jgi:flavin reductase (DIM6/NTAB) family NADH-FMN oxidoreductase RutF
MQHEADEWLQLQDRKQWSRLLYTNPVCFLCTTSPNSAARNVMVLSWLTATNNTGQFIFSLNRRRHSASLLLFRENDDNSGAAPCSGRRFTLSVPVQGMEDLVRSVGQVSGAQVNKFASAVSNSAANVDLDEVDGPKQPMSKRQKKKMLMENGANGIPWLRAIPPSVAPVSADDSLICIDGTVAHMVCRVQQILDTTENADHWLVLAQVEAASVHPSYWDREKNLFRPLGVPPYLAFFGSQTFGYVVTAEYMEQGSNSGASSNNVEQNGR